jgi:hypothetical protein
MPSLTLSAVTTAPIEEVWKLLHDPSRFPEWWEGIETVVRNPDGSTYTIWPQGYPDFPMAQRMQATGTGVTISCLVSDLMFYWQLAETGSRTEIRVEVEFPDREAHRLPTQQALLRTSLDTLAALAAAS